MLASPSLLCQMRGFLEERYPRLAFAFDISAPAAAGQPGGGSRNTAAPRVNGVALSWRNGQAVYVPIAGEQHERELVAELAALFGSGRLEKATWDLKSQLAALCRAYGPVATAVFGQGAGGTEGVGLAVQIAGWPLCYAP